MTDDALTHPPSEALDDLAAHLVGHPLAPTPPHLVGVRHHCSRCASCAQELGRRRDYMERMRHARAQQPVVASIGLADQICAAVADSAPAGLPAQHHPSRPSVVRQAAPAVLAAACLATVVAVGSSLINFGPATPDVYNNAAEGTPASASIGSYGSSEASTMQATAENSPTPAQSHVLDSAPEVPATQEGTNRQVVDVNTPVAPPLWTAGPPNELSEQNDDQQGICLQQLAINFDSVTKVVEGTWNDQPAQAFYLKGAQSSSPLVVISKLQCTGQKADELFRGTLDQLTK